MEITTNNWHKGMISDLALSLEQNSNALHIENFRLITDTGNTTTALVNIKGMEHSFEFPIISSVEFLSFSGSEGLAHTVTITIDGLSDNFTSTTWTSYLELYGQVAAFINASAVYNTVNTYYAFAQPTGVVIYSVDTFSNINITVPAFSRYTVTRITSSNSVFKLIGWTTIRETLILLTSVTSNPNPGGHDSNQTADPSAAGQIWKVVFDNLGNATITLLYNNLVDFTPHHPVPSPGAIVGRYEKSDIQRIYWTDNFNRPRSFNTADPDGFGVPVASLFNQTEVTQAIPILQEIVAGILPAGVYQYAFRLSKANGAKTVYSVPSNLISVISPSETTAAFEAWTYTVPGTVTSKGLRLRIEGLDVDYDRVEIVSIYYDTPSTMTPIINTIKDEELPSDGIFEFIHTGNEDIASISIEEYTLSYPIIERVKTLASKDNRLFYGNLIENRLRLNFDARAFRYDANGDSYTHDDDSINDNQSPIPSEVGYIFQDPVVAGGLVFGGTGPNISYEFVPDINDIAADNADAQAAEIVLDDVTFRGTRPPYRVFSRDNYTYDLTTNEYPHVSTFRHFGTSYTNAIRGYHRDEIYRFGIVFFDLLGCPSYVNWIGDIRMPHAWMPSTTSPANAVLDSQRTLTYPQSTFRSPTDYFGFSLGVKFTITLTPEIAAQISGYSIVRVDRASTDKTILGQGMFRPAWNDTTLATPESTVFLVDGGNNPEVHSATNMTHGSPTVNSNLAVDTSFASMYIPEHLFGTESFAYNGSDYLDFVGCLESNSVPPAYKNSVDIVTDGAGNIKGEVVKNYTHTSLGSMQADIFNYTGGRYGGYVELSNNCNIDYWANYQGSYGTFIRPTTGTPGSAAVYNVAVPYDSGAQLDSYSMGSKCLMVVSKDVVPSGGGLINSMDAVRVALCTNNPILISHGVGTEDYREAIFNYKRVRLNQYNGNTLSARSTNIYQPTGHYQPVDDNTVLTKEAVVYGGDTYVVAMEVCPKRKNWKDSVIFDTNTNSHEEFRNLKANFFVCETTVNTELRTNPNQRMVNKDYFPDGGTGLDLIDDYALDHTYGRSKQITSYFVESETLTLLDEFDTRIRGSEQKENGEFSDSWGVFKAGTYIDVEGIYGPLNNLIIKDNNMLFLQDQAIGVVEVNTRAAIQSTTGQELSIGTAGLLSRFDYISTEIGSKHQWGMVMGTSDLYFYDALKTKIYRLGKGLESLGEFKQLSGFLNRNLIGSGTYIDNPVLLNGMSCTYDYKFNEVYFTFHTDVTDSWTLVYNELIDAWAGFYTFTPPIYITTGNRLISSNDDQNYYIHNIGNYGVFYGAAPVKSKVKFVINPKPGTTKKFEVFTWNSNVVDETANSDIENATWNRNRVYNTFQNNGFEDFIIKPTTNFNVARNRNREWTSHIRRNAVITGLSNVDVLLPANLDSTQLNKPRMYDNYVIADFEYDNLNNYKFICPYISTVYR